MALPLLLMTYVTGVALGCWRTDGPFRKRLGLALLWPLGPAACVVTLTMLGVAAIVLFPLMAMAAAAAAAGLALWMS